MLLCGTYTAIAILPISTSLQSLNDDFNRNHVYKVLLQSTTNVVAYFVGLEFGKGSVIKVVNESKGLLLKEDYEVVLKKEYFLDKEFVNRMIEIARNKSKP